MTYLTSLEAIPGITASGAPASVSTTTGGSGNCCPAGTLTSFVAPSGTRVCLPSGAECADAGASGGTCSVFNFAPCFESLKPYTIAAGVILGGLIAIWIFSKTSEGTRPVLLIALAIALLWFVVVYGGSLANLKAGFGGGTPSTTAPTTSLPALQLTP